jgi:hypothetical protein
MYKILNSKKVAGKTYNPNTKVVLFEESFLKKNIEGWSPETHSQAFTIMKDWENYDAIVQALELGTLSVYGKTTKYNDKFELGYSIEEVSSLRRMALTAKFAQDLGINDAVVSTIIQETARNFGGAIAQARPRRKEQPKPEHEQEQEFEDTARNL